MSAQTESSSETTPANIARRYFEAINQADLQAIEDLLAVDYRHHIAGLPQGRAAIQRMIAMYLTGFSDFHITIEDMVVDRDRVVVRSTTTARHTGMFMGHSATGRQFRAMGIDIFQIAQRQISEHWSLFDTMTMLQQLGLRH
jgi:steroid delta-isomerase-like uncharacterized protein